MAIDTSKSLRNMVLYSVYVRNYSAEGTFKALEKDLDRIKELGVDYIWLLPIHPIGVEQRKGTLGSPYAIVNYREVNPELGTLDDLKSLAGAIHKRGMKCMFDVVFNHTSPDSWLSKNHPEWFYKKPDGNFGNRVGEWWDVIDLDFNQKGLWDYLIETLVMWADIADGFRCDVAPLIPLEFWLRARSEVAARHPDFLWLSESVEPSFTVDNRSRGMVSLSDSEIFQAFDVSYEYDIYSYFHAYLSGRGTLEEYARQINAQEYIYPDNYVKLRCLENHDQPRARFVIHGEKALANWTAFLYFQKGMTMLYAGQEKGNTVKPDLFNKDDVTWDTGVDLSGMFSRLYSMKKNPILTDSTYNVSSPVSDVLYCTHRGKAGGKSGTMHGFFSLKGEPVVLRADIPDGVHTNLVDGGDVRITNGLLALDGLPAIIELP